MKELLITAFEPFGGFKENPALLVMNRLRPGAFPGWRLLRRRLPVSGEAVGRLAPGLIERHRPDVMVSLGLAAGEGGLRVERFALNIKDYGIKDNSGQRPAGEPVRKGGPAAYEVGADPVRLAAAARRAGAPAHVSNFAGAYVCNHLMYESLHAIARKGLATSYAFLHLPLATEMALRETSGRAVPSLPLDLLVKASAAAIKAALRSHAIGRTERL